MRIFPGNTGEMLPLTCLEGRAFVTKMSGEFAEASTAVVRSLQREGRLGLCGDVKEPLSAINSRSSHQNPPINHRIYSNKGNLFCVIREKMSQPRSAIYNSAFFFFSKRPLFRCRRATESHKAVKRNRDLAIFVCFPQMQTAPKYSTANNRDLPAVEPVLASIALDHKLGHVVR